MNRKTTLLTLILAIVGFASFSQNIVYAEDIMNDIKAGKDISISNATIEGVLDFTNMEEKLKTLPRKKRRKENNSIMNSIRSKISFTNCTFNFDVLAYIPDHDKSGYTFIANFYEPVLFKNCTFERRAMFKHSDFVKESSFENTQFLGGTTFKHANFKDKSNFAKTNFEDGVTFKHVQFRKTISFEGASFDEDVTFKHAKFYNGLSFKNVRFKGALDIKHTDIRGDFEMAGMKISSDIDSKHTVINGKSFASYLLDNRR
jgi:uncharacterized protein YjbI with pentapeptide repeats